MKLHQIFLAGLLMVTIVGSTGQNALAFGSTPSDATITVDNTLDLNWTVSGSDLSYTITMVYSGNDTGSVVGSGMVFNEHIGLKLSSLDEGDYVFTCEVSNGASTITDDVTITVSGSTSEASSNGGGGGFLPGFSWIYLIFTTATIIFLRKLYWTNHN